MSSERNEVKSALTFGREEVRHRKVSLTRVIVEGQDPRPVAKFGQLFLHSRKRCSGRNPNEDSLFAGRAASHLLGFLGSDIDNSVEGICVEDAGDEVRSEPLD